MRIFGLSVSLLLAGAMMSVAATQASENGGGVKVAPPDRTSWATFRNGPLQQGVAGSELPEELELLWKRPTEYGVVAASAIVGEHVYVPALEGRLFCLEKRTGKEIWTYRSIESNDPDDFAPGFKSAPTVTDEMVFIGDEDGVLHALYRATGKKKWAFSTDGEIAGNPMIVGGKLILGSRDGFLYNLNAADGSLNWKYQVDGPINCSPAIVEKYTFTAGCEGGNLVVIDIESGKRASEIKLGVPVLSSPAIMGEMLYLGTHDGEVLGIDWKKESVIWMYSDPAGDGSFDASAAVTDKYVVVGGHDRKMHCIDRKTGKGVWTFPTRARIDSSPVIVGDRVFFGSADRNVYGVSLSDGKQLWKYNTGGGVSASPAVGEGVLVIGAEDSGGAVFCFGRKD